MEVDGKICFDKLPVLEPRIREILLKWLSDAMESADFRQGQTMEEDIYWTEVRQEKTV